MKIIVNGEQREVAEGLCLSDLVTELGLSGRRIAIELNQDLVPRAEHGACALSAGDHVEIITAVGGG